MLTLIKREFVDMAVFYLTTSIFILILAGVSVYGEATVWSCDQVIGVPSVMFRIFGIFLFLPLLATVLGTLQMNLDRDKKVSSFLATLATTRQQILSAKIITGILWLLSIVLPIAVSDVVLLKLFPMIAVPEFGFLICMFVTLFLCSLACYSFGLLIGWRSGKWVLALGIILVTPLLVSLVVIKGFGMQTMLFFILFIFAAIIRTWQKFMSTSL